MNDIEPPEPRRVSPPADLAAALEKIPGAAESWQRLAASHQRELTRFLHDARTPGTRRRHVELIVAEVLGEEVQPPGTRHDRPLWTCPLCGRQFVTRNMYHSCSRHTLDEPFRDRPVHIRQLFDVLRRAVESNGRVTLVPYRDRVAFMVRVRFAGARPRNHWLDVDFWLTRRVESPRFQKVETLTPYTHIHTVRVTDPSDIDDELIGWLREAYAVGCQEHLRAPR